MSEAEEATEAVAHSEATAEDEPAREEESTATFEPVVSPYRALLRIHIMSLSTDLGQSRLLLLNCYHSSFADVVAVAVAVAVARMFQLELLLAHVFLPQL